MGNYFKAEYYKSLDDMNQKQLNGYGWPDTLATSISYSGNGFHTTNLGRYCPWSGSKKELALNIKNLIDKNLFYADYVIVGHLSFILSECPYDHDFIIIN